MPSDLPTHLTGRAWVMIDVEVEKFEICFESYNNDTDLGGGEMEKTDSYNYWELNN